MSSSSESGAGQTCVTCRVIFARAELQREHYKTDWHRYNLKRKVASLPPVTAEAFQNKVIAQQQAEPEADNSSYRCEACNKSFRSKETFNNHCGSKKHVDNETKRGGNVEKEKLVEGPVMEGGVEEDEDIDSDSSWGEGEGLGLEECLFCEEVGKSLEEKLLHMSVAHGFFIPDLQYCVDLPGLILYLGEKVGVGFVCLWCNERGKAFYSLDAVQKHMKDKSHCRLCHDGTAFLEFQSYYDYRSSYPDGKEEDEEVDISAMVERDWQLVLPSGATLGHRNLNKYFKQRLKPQSAISVRNAHKGAVNKVLSHYKALGWTGASGEAAVRRAKDIGFMNRISAKQSMKVGIKGNRVNQTHFRSQNP